MLDYIRYFYIFYYEAKCRVLSVFNATSTPASQSVQTDINNPFEIDYS